MVGGKPPLIASRGTYEDTKPRDIAAESGERWLRAAPLHHRAAAYGDVAAAAAARMMKIGYVEG